MEPTMFTSVPIQTLVQMVADAVLKSLANDATINNITKKDTLLTRKQAAEILQISLPTLNQWTKLNIIKAKRVNTTIRYYKSDVLAALESYNKFGRKV